MKAIWVIWVGVGYSEQNVLFRTLEAIKHVANRVTKIGKKLSF